MEQMNIGENILRLRREHRITQEVLADFVGVTKASVSKWETNQSKPDILLLPQLAAFFGVTVDELLGYESQLSKEQIQKLYRELAEDFTRLELEQVEEKIDAYVNRYYSCYPFLFQVCILWLNHYMLAQELEKQAELLKRIQKLCGRIQEGSRDSRLCGDAAMLSAMVSMYLGKPQELITILEEERDPGRLSQQGEALLTSAYLMKGDLEKARSFSQISMYLNLCNLLGNASRYLAACAGELPVIRETVRRIGRVIEEYRLVKLMPNNAAGFAYQAALSFLAFEEKEEALGQLKIYMACLRELVGEEGLLLHGDDYFDRLEHWIQRLDSGAEAPRDRKSVLRDMAASLDAPAFAPLGEDKIFRQLKTELREILHFS